MPRAKASTAWRGGPASRSLNTSWREAMASMSVSGRQRKGMRLYNSRPATVASKTWSKLRSARKAGMVSSSVAPSSSAKRMLWNPVVEVGGIGAAWTRALMAASPPCRTGAGRVDQPGSQTPGHQMGRELGARASRACHQTSTVQASVEAISHTALRRRASSPLRASLPRLPPGAGSKRSRVPSGTSGPGGTAGILSPSQRRRAGGEVPRRRRRAGDGSRRHRPSSLMGPDRTP